MDVIPAASSMGSAHIDDGPEHLRQKSPEDIPESLPERSPDRPPVYDMPANSQIVSEEAAAAAQNLIDDPNLKLDIPESLDHEHFSKLLELDSKNDDDLFSSTDLLEHEITQEAAKLDKKTSDAFPTDNEPQQLSPIPDLSELEKLSAEHGGEEQLGPPSTAQDLKSENDEKVTSAFVTDPVLAENRAGSHNMYNSDQLSTGAGTREDTPTSIFESKHVLADEGKQNTTSPTKLESVPLPAPLPENAVNKVPHPLPNEPASQLPMTEFHDSATSETEQSKISAYARLDFQSFTFYVQTLQVIIGRRSENDFSHKVDVNLGASKSISRRHAQIFYNFGTGRFELSIMGKNGAFVDDTFVERGLTVCLLYTSRCV